MNSPETHLDALGAAPGAWVKCDECGTLFAARRGWSRFCKRKCRNDFHIRERRKRAIEARALVMFEALLKIAAETGTPYATIAAEAIKDLKAP